MVAMVGMCEIIGWGRGMIYRHEEEPNTNKLWLRGSIMIRYAPSYPHSTCGIIEKEHMTPWGTRVGEKAIHRCELGEADGVGPACRCVHPS
jgi:hypothetical protein